jgi:hypothetical protein
MAYIIRIGKKRKKNYFPQVFKKKAEAEKRLKIIEKQPTKNFFYSIRKEKMEIIPFTEEEKFNKIQIKIKNKKPVSVDEIRFLERIYRTYKIPYTKKEAEKIGKAKKNAYETYWEKSDDFPIGAVAGGSSGAMAG